VFKRRRARHLPPVFCAKSCLTFGEKLCVHSYNTSKQIISTLLSKRRQEQLQRVGALLSKGPQQQLQCVSALLSKGLPTATIMCKYSAFKRPQQPSVMRKYSACEGVPIRNCNMCVGLHLFQRASNNNCIVYKCIPFKVAPNSNYTDREVGGDASLL